MRPLLVVFFSALNALGCSGKDQAKDQPYKARIVAYTPTGYALQVVEYKTLTDPDGVSGTVTEILGNAALNAEAKIEEIIDPNQHDKIYLDKGRKPEIDYYLKDGVIEPRNFESMEMLGIYFTYENVVQFWIDNMDLDFDSFGRLRIYYAPRIKAVGDVAVEQTIKVNAAFLPGPRDFLFFQTSKLEKIPVNMNFGVVAHEFSHAIFDYVFGQKDAGIYETDNEEAAEQLRGINEGLADFYSLMVTGRMEEFGDSLDILADDRKLPSKWDYKGLEGSGCKGGPYCKGSILASALDEVVTSLSKTRLDVGKVIYTALDQFRADWVGHRNDADFDYHYLLNRIIAAADEGERSAYCASFRKWFNKDGFAEKLNCS